MTLTAHILALQPRGQLGYLNSNVMLRWDDYFKWKNIGRISCTAPVSSIKRELLRLLLVYCFVVRIFDLRVEIFQESRSVGLCLDGTMKWNDIRICM